MLLRDGAVSSMLAFVRKDVFFFSGAKSQDVRFFEPSHVSLLLIKENPRSSTGSDPFSITAGPDGNLWFTELDGNRIGRITPTGNITEFHLVATCAYPDGCGPIGITTGQDGNLWFTLFDGNSIEGITPSGTFIGGGATPTRTSRPYGITAGPDGNLWFTEYIGNKIGRLSLH